VRQWATDHGIRCAEIDVWPADKTDRRLTAAEEAARAGRSWWSPATVTDQNAARTGIG